MLNTSIPMNTVTAMQLWIGRMVGWLVGWIVGLLRRTRNKAARSGSGCARRTQIEARISVDNPPKRRGQQPYKCLVGGSVRLEASQ